MVSVIQSRGSQPSLAVNSSSDWPESSRCHAIAIDVGIIGTSFGHTIMKRKRFRRRSDSICRYPGCPNITTGDYCQVHSGYSGMTAWQAESKQFLNSRAWQAARSAKLAETPWCEYCAEAGRGEFIPAIDVDHIKPRHSYRELWLDPQNLKSACKQCHGEKTGRGQ